MSRKKKISRRKNIKRSIRRTLRSKSRNMNGGGIPFAGTLTTLINTTHDRDQNIDSLIDNLCVVNNLKKPVNGDIELHNLINNICNVNHGIKKSKKNNGVIKSAMRLIGTVATLPLRTASKAINSVTGVDPTDIVKNMVVNNTQQKAEETPYKMAISLDKLKEIDQKIKSGGSLSSDEVQMLNSL